jgi:CheY-like chemotaxis protein
MFKRTLAYCQQIRQEVKESWVHGPVSDFVAPPLHLLLPQENMSTVISPPIIEASVITDVVTARTTYESPTSVLLVDDNAINLKLLVACVKKTKFDYITATDGAEAVDVYSSYSGKISLIFMDIQMPVMDGTEATRRIRQHERDNSLPRARIVALTALGSEEAKQLALDCGVDAFLTKPVPLKILTSLLREHCKTPR